MDDLAELEIGLQKWAPDAYTLEARYRLPGDDADYRDGPVQARFDRVALRAAELTPQAYGRILSEALFSNPAVWGAFKETRAQAIREGFSLRVRLAIDESAGELHALHWEMLRDPQWEGFLCMDQHLWFSRYLSGLPGTKVRPKEELKALAAANSRAFVSSSARLR